MAAGHRIHHVSYRLPSAAVSRLLAMASAASLLLPFVFLSCCWHVGCALCMHAINCGVHCPCALSFLSLLPSDTGGLPSSSQSRWLRAACIESPSWWHRPSSSGEGVAGCRLTNGRMLAAVRLQHASKLLCKTLFSTCNLPLGVGPNCSHLLRGSLDSHTQQAAQLDLALLYYAGGAAVWSSRAARARGG